MRIADSLVIAVAVLSLWLHSSDAFSVSKNVGYHRSSLISSSSSSSSLARMSMKSPSSGIQDTECSGSNMVPKTTTRLSTQRLAAVSLAISSCLLSFSCASFAGDKGAGTITDKKYELCVSKCVFSETRPPPNGADNERILTTISRTDIIKDCRKTCAKTKEQLYLGKPKIKAGSVQQAEQ